MNRKKTISMALAIITGCAFAACVQVRQPLEPAAQAKTAVTKVERTFAMIKPDAVQHEYSGVIIKLIEQNGFKILRMQKRTLTRAQAEQFYAIHKERPFFKDLVSFITSGPVVVLALEKDNAIADWRELIGTTDPAQARMGTLRKMFAESKSKNAVHGSDSPETAQQELRFFFKDL